MFGFGWALGSGWVWMRVVFGANFGAGHDWFWLIWYGLAWFRLSYRIVMIGSVSDGSLLSIVRYALNGVVFNAGLVLD